MHYINTWPTVRMQVIYMDSDATPLISPVELFNTREYLASGNMFFPDISCSEPGLYSRLHVSRPHSTSGPDFPQTEAGAFVINR